MDISSSAVSAPCRWDVFNLRLLTHVLNNRKSSRMQDRRSFSDTSRVNVHYVLHDLLMFATQADNGRTQRRGQHGKIKSKFLSAKMHRADALHCIFKIRRPRLHRDRLF